MSDTRLYSSVGRIESSVLDLQEVESAFRLDKQDGGLTIFIPNFNHRSFLPGSLRGALDALECLEKRDFPAEVLVIDDASRDGSQKLLRTIQALYGDTRLRTLCLRQNLGLTALRNLALAVSRFRHVLMLDADNELNPDPVSTILRAALKTGAALVYGNLIDEQDGKLVGIRSNIPASWALVQRNRIDGFAVVDAEKLLELGGYTRAHPYSPDDWEMLLHLMAEEQEIVLVPVILGRYHKLEGSGSYDNRPFNEQANAALKRVYAQTGFRAWDYERVGRIYHPDVGYLDEW